MWLAAAFLVSLPAAALGFGGARSYIEGHVLADPEGLSAGVSVRGKRRGAAFQIPGEDMGHELCPRGVRRMVDAVEQGLAKYRGTPLSSAAHRLARGSTDAASWQAAIEAVLAVDDRTLVRH